jgi:hypothetical protein
MRLSMREIGLLSLLTVRLSLAIGCISKAVRLTAWMFDVKD